VTAQFDPSQQLEALALIESCPWGSLDDHIRDMETALRLAMEMTADDYWRWENEFRPVHEFDAAGNIQDELTYPADVVGEMSDEEKRAYVAGLIRVLALAYGVNSELGLWHGGLPIVGEASPGSLAALLRGLNDICWLPMAGLQSSAAGR
jgi:hypothetical protein